MMRETAVEDYRARRDEKGAPRRDDVGAFALFAKGARQEKHMDTRDAPWRASRAAEWRFRMRPSHDFLAREAFSEY